MKRQHKTSTDQDASANENQRRQASAPDEPNLEAVAGGWMYMDWGGGMYGMPNSWNDMYAPSSGWSGYYF